MDAPIARPAPTLADSGFAYPEPRYHACGWRSDRVVVIAWTAGRRYPYPFDAASSWKGAKTLPEWDDDDHPERADEIREFAAFAIGGPVIRPATGARGSTGVVRGRLPIGGGARE